MSEEKKEYSNEMRGTLWAETERKNDKAPIATGSITISGVELRLALWPALRQGFILPSTETVLRELL